MGDEKRTNLGRGLSALLGADSGDYASLDQLRVSKMVPIEYVHPGKYQPRHDTNDADLEGLAQSIAERGVLQPIVVRRNPGQPNDYEIVAGERRWRAAQIAKLHEVPVVIKDLSDSEALEVALVENLQRHDLNAIEEAEGYQRLMDEFAHTQEQLSKVVGKSRSHVANTMRLLSLPDTVRSQVEGGSLSAGHARALLNSPNVADLAEEVVRRGLNVRQTEQLARTRSTSKKAAAPRPAADADTLALQRDLSNALGLKVEIKARGSSGSLLIHYSNLEQLDDVLTRLSQAPRGERRTAAVAPAPAIAKPQAEARSAGERAEPPKQPAAPVGGPEPRLAVKLTPTKPAAKPRPPMAPAHVTPPEATRPPTPPLPSQQPAAEQPAAETDKSARAPTPAPAPKPPLPSAQPAAEQPAAETAQPAARAPAPAPAPDPPSTTPPVPRPAALQLHERPAAAPPAADGGSWVAQATRGEIAEED